jgi:hypothetical protein
MAVTFTHGSKAVFKISDSIPTVRDISNVLKTANLKRTADTADTSAMGSSAKSFIPGLLDATLSIDGFCDVTTAGYIASVLGAITPFEFGPEGTTTGNEKYTGNAIVNDLEINADVGSAVSIKGTLQVTGGVTRATY